MSKKILFVMTGVDYWTLADGTRHSTGFWAEEAVAPYRALTAAGHTITVATPGGVIPTADPVSLTAGVNGGENGAREVAAALSAISELRSPVPLEEVELADYDAVFYPGGHGPMEDLSANADSGRLLTAALESGMPLAVVCHGGAALLAAVGPDGTNSFKGYKVAAFTAAEETQTGLAARAKWVLETRLVEAGVEVIVDKPWASHVVVDRNLVTGQNPSSSAALAVELVKKLA
jgi:putative intracellular protease/amidase